MDSQSLTRDLPDLAATETLGRLLGAVLRPGDVVALTGALGAGKTALARAAVRARLGEPELEVPSPTFTLAQIYTAGDLLEIWHVDLYRLDDPEESLELGLDDAFATGAALIEWPERLGPFLPSERLDISLDQTGGTRRAELIFRGERWRERLERFR
jgi:tRNA threonylcarbamoyl adenosine modification protein YjeE